MEVPIFYMVCVKSCLGLVFITQFVSSQCGVQTCWWRAQLVRACIAPILAGVQLHVHDMGLCWWHACCALCRFTLETLEGAILHSQVIVQS